MGRLSNQVVAITGASAGIGRACALRCATDGASVVLSARRADRLAEAVREIEAKGGRAIAVPGDVSSETDMANLVVRAIEAFGHLDVMICNAGIGFHGPLDETPPDAMRRLVDVNLMGTLYAAHAAMVAMRRQGHGHIIAISSIVGRRGVEGSSVYAATKAAQIGLIEALRAEFVGSGFRASVVYPVGTVTEFREAMHRDFGYAVSGAGPRQSADQVADRVADCIAAPRAEVYPYAAGWLLAILSVVAPATADRVVRRFGRRRKPQESARA